MTRRGLRRPSVRGAALLGLLLAGAGCASKPDYSGLETYYRRAPKTVLILPARNMTTDAEAPAFLMSTVATPLIARGYYVIPPYLFADVLAHEGIDLAGESWEVDPQRYHDHFGADAILYVTINEWDTQYRVVQSAVVVGMEYRLVDAQSGEEIWTQAGNRTVRSGGKAMGGGGLLGLAAGLIVDSVDAAVTAASTRYVTLAADVNRSAFDRLPVGSYHADYEKVQATIAKWREEQDRAAAAAAATAAAANDEGKN